MSQFSADRLCRAIAVRVQTAWPEVANSVDIDSQRLPVAPDKASVICNEIRREDGGIRRNRWVYVITVYGRFATPNTGQRVAQAKDEKADALYAAVITSDGRLSAPVSNSPGPPNAPAAYNIRCESVDRRDYVPDGEKSTGQTYYDLAVTFTMQADVAY